MPAEEVVAVVAGNSKELLASAGPTSYDVCPALTKVLPITRLGSE